MAATETVYTHRREGNVKARRQARSDDLEFAIEWLEAYEGDPTDDLENLEALATAADFLRREIARRTRR